jgi:hypothetical protein
MRISVTALIVLLSALAFADTMDKLGQALKHRNFKVRAQAAIVIGKLKDPRGVPLLIQALGDKEAAVRALAASALGKLRDPTALEALASRMNDPSSLVRDAVGKALGQIEDGPDEGPAVAQNPKGSGRFSVEISPVAANKGGPEMAKFVSGEVATHIGKLGNVSLEPEPNAPRYFVDLSITKLNADQKDAQGHVKVNCELSVIIATHPDHAMKSMSTVWTSVEEEGGSPRGIAAAQNFCLGETAKMAAEKLETYLKGVR